MKTLQQQEVLAQDQTTEGINKYTPYLISVISIVTMLFWVNFSNKFYYIGIATVLFLFSVLNFINKKIFINFFLLCIFANNLMDEVFFNPLKLGLNEILVIPITIILWKILYKK